jgi:hypothetical protein
MILISHRGNINGRITERENHPDYIDEAIALGYDVEIDIWIVGMDIMLGHDEPQYTVTTKWLEQRLHKLWIHCKNIPALEYASYFHNKEDLNYFWHEYDTVTLTSKGHIWAYPGKQPIQESIAVMPELCNDTLTQCKGICSDHIQNYKK